MSNDNIKWLRRELPGWVAQGILSEEGAQRLQAQYADAEEESGHSLTFTLTATLGAVLIAAGIIALFAYNWDEFGRIPRTIVGLMPLLLGIGLYSYAYFKKPESASWREGAGGFLSLSLLGSLAMISQIYQMGGQLEDLLLAWALLTIPLLYLLPSTLPFMFFAIGLNYWTLQAQYEGRQELWYFLIMLVTLPHILKSIKKNKPDAAGTITEWTVVCSLLSVWWAIFGQEAEGRIWIGYALLCSSFYLTGKSFLRGRDYLWQRPMQTVGILGTVLTAMFFTFPMFGRTSRGDLADIFFHSQIDTIHKLAFLLFALLWVGYVGYLFLKKRKEVFINPFVAFFPALLYLGFATYAPWGLIQLAMNLFLLGMGVLYLNNGIKLRRPAIVNAGMFLISALILARFFDSDLSLLVKGLAFIATGAGFLSANVFLMRKMKKDASQV